MSPSPNWPIIDELEKQYDVVRVDPSKPITEKYDVLLAVQPSTLGPEEMNNFVAAVAAGQPTAIFEDPAPLLSDVPATSMPRQPPGGMNPMMRMQSPPKGDINKLWNLLGIDFSDSKIVWQDFNPYPKVPDFTENKEFVFADVGAGAKEPFNPADPISSGLQQVLFPFPGFIDKQTHFGTEIHAAGGDRREDRHAPLRRPHGDVALRPARRQPQPPADSDGRTYILAAHIQGKVKLPPSIDDPFKNPDEKKGEKKPVEGTVNVVVTTDVDMLSQAVLRSPRAGRKAGNRRPLPLRQRHLRAEHPRLAGRATTASSRFASGGPPIACWPASRRRPRMRSKPRPTPARSSAKNTTSRNRRKKRPSRTKSPN